MTHVSGNPSWQDFPATTTPVDAAALENIENAVDHVRGAGAKTVTAAYACTSTDTLVMADASAQKPPTGLYGTPSASGGTFAARAAPNGYYWTVTATGPNGESIGLNNATALPIAANGSCVLNWNAAPSATGYKVYRAVFADSGHPPITSQVLVATLGNVTTYTDTGTAGSAGSPPATNGGAFTVTLPDATTYLPLFLQVKAIGDTPNLVTLATTGGQTIDGKATIALGQVAGADYQSVMLAPSGGNWHVVANIPVPLSYAISSSFSYGVSPNAGALAGGYTALAVVPVPYIGFGQRIRISFSLQLLAATGATEAYIQVVWCKSDGTYVTYNSGADWLNGTQIAFWYLQNFSPNEYSVVAGEWQYNPRPGDFNVEGSPRGAGHWDQYTSYIGLLANMVGSGSSTFASSQVGIEAGAVGASYFGAA